MLKTLFRLLNVAYRPVHRFARLGAWIFGIYGILILLMALAAERAAESWPVYGKPLACALALVILDRLFEAGLHRLARR